MFNLDKTSFHSSGFYGSYRYDAQYICSKNIFDEGKTHNILINWGFETLITSTTNGNGLAVLYFAVHNIRMPELISYCTIHF